MESSGVKSARERGSNRNHYASSEKAEPATSREKKEKQPGRFRFEDLEIWRMGMDISEMIYDISTSLKRKQENLLAERLIESACNIPDLIAEGSAASSDSVFDRILDQARGSVFRTANILFLLRRLDLIPESDVLEQQEILNILGRRIYSFQKILKGENPRSRK